MTENGYGSKSCPCTLELILGLVVLLSEVAFEVFLAESPPSFGLLFSQFLAIQCLSVVDDQPCM